MATALKTSAAVGRLLKRRRQELRLTLRQVSDRLAAERSERIPVSTLARIEQGKLDPGVRRLHLLLRVYDVPAHLVSDLVELEALAVEPPAEKDLEKLYECGIEHWKQGNIAEGLAHLFAVREHVPGDDAARLLRQKAALGFGIAARNLGKYNLAKQITEDLLLEPPDDSLASRVMVLAASVWCGLGSHDAALAFAHQAAARVRPNDHQEAAWVLHGKAKILLDLGRADEAEEVLGDALSHYRARKDSYGEARALILKARILETLGRTKDASASLRKVVKISQDHGHAKLVNAGSLEHGRLLVKTGDAKKGLEVLRQALADAVVRDDRNAQFFAHHYLWKAHEALGEPDRARFELESARYFVSFIDEASPEAEEVRGSHRETGSPGA